MDLLDFSKTFELECDVSGIDINATLVHDGHPITYLSEKFYEPTLNYLIYDKEFYAIVSLKDSLISFLFKTVIRKVSWIISKLIKLLLFKEQILFNIRKSNNVHDYHLIYYKCCIQIGFNMIG